MRVVFGNIEFNTDDCSKKVKDLADLLIMTYLKESTTLCDTKLSDTITISIPDFVPNNLLFGDRIKLHHETNRWHYNSLLKDMADEFIVILLSGYPFVIFYRRCFMQLKTFSNLRF